MSNEAIFATRISQINKTARVTDRKRKKVRSRSFGSLLVTPLMVAAFMSGGVLYKWETLDRPTDTPFEFASNLTARAFSD